MARTPVSRDLAKPRKPPTPVRPVGLAAWAGSEADPSVRLLGLSTGDELADDEGKMREVETLGAGSTATSRAATAATATPATPRVSQGTPRVPDIDCHMATSPHTPHADPGHHVDAQGEVDRLGRGHRHQGGRAGQRVGDVPAGRHVEGVGAQHPGEQDGQGRLDRGDVPGGGVVADRGDEPHEPADGADGQDGLDHRPRPVPPPVGQGVADHRGRDGEHGHRRRSARPGSSTPRRR